MPLRVPRTTAFVLMAAAFLLFLPRTCNAQAALLLEEPYGFFGTLNPTGHTAVYFARICAASPVKLRRCEPGEMGSVISRYSDVAHHDWVIIPLLPYLYSLENASDVPTHVDRATVTRIRDQYHETHLLSLGKDVRKGDFWHGGWTELVGVTYDRRIYALRFDTTEAQDDAFIERMNKDKNRSHFELFYNNCADFSRNVLNQYFPHSFGRSFFPDAGMTTPKQITHKLNRYGAKHPEIHLATYEIPQIPGYRRPSRSNKGISESLITTGYALPIAILNPYVAGGLFVDYVAHGRYKLVPKNPPKLMPDDLAQLTTSPDTREDSLNPSDSNHSVADAHMRTDIHTASTNTGVSGVMATHE
jgi:hypothetical protein